MFQVVLEDYRALCLTQMADQGDFVRLQTVPGIGPILALIILVCYPQRARPHRPYQR